MSRFPTPEETARIMGVSKADLKWLRALAEREMPTGGPVPNGTASDLAPSPNKKSTLRQTCSQNR